MKKNYYSIFIAIIISLSACKKTEKLSTDEKQRISNKTASGGIISQPFDWETADLMPTLPGTQVLVPWASGVSRQFSAEIAADFKKIDGWEMVYNTFNTTTAVDAYYFILYNKYRGLLRMYYYQPNYSTVVPSTNIAHTLRLTGTNISQSPIMNYSASDIVDYGTNTPSASTLELWQIAPSTWYAFEYEVAYDKNLAAQNQFAISFQWPITFNSVSSITLNGTSIGTAKGNITLSGGDLTISPSISIGNDGGTINMKGDSDVEKIKPSISSELFSSLKGLVTKGITKVAGGLIDKIFSGIFGGKKESNQDNVNLKINTQISITGEVKSNALIGSQVFSIPGYNQSSATGRVPMYNQTLGVFYPANKPTIIETTHISTTPTGLPPKRTYVYKVDVSKLNFDLNPAVTSIASVQQRGLEVVVKYAEGADYSGGIETVGDSKYIVGPMVGVANQKPAVVGIRVTFDVIPHDGSTKSVLVKTFKADLSKVTVKDPPGEDPW